MSRPPDLVQRLARWGWPLLDVALAVVLAVGTLERYTQVQQDTWWWIWIVPAMVGIAIRRYRPLLAFALASVGVTIHHLSPAGGLDYLDFALPLTLYTLASSGWSRRTTVLALGGALAGVALLSVLNVMIQNPDAVPDTGSFADPRKFGTPAPAPESKPTDKPEKPIDTTADGGGGEQRPVAASDVVATAAGEGVGAMLVLGLASAVGDGVRSRRAYLRSLEQRAAELEREQHQRVALATAAERARITREMHDVVAHGLSVIVVQAQGGAAALERHPDRTAEAIQNVIMTGRQSLAEMRRLLDIVRRDPAEDPELAPRPGVGALPDLVDRVRAAGTVVSFTVDGTAQPLPASVDLSAYRIAQEALTNTIKHAGPGARAAVRLSFAPDGLEIEVTDDGIGGPIPAGGGGTGLRGIAERIGILGGELTAGPGESGGFRVRALLPLAPA